jgi:hypothetical protein
MYCYCSVLAGKSELGGVCYFLTWGGHIILAGSWATLSSINPQLIFILPWCSSSPTCSHSSLHIIHSCFVTFIPVYCSFGPYSSPDWPHSSRTWPESSPALLHSSFSLASFVPWLAILIHNLAAILPLLQCTVFHPQVVKDNSEKDRRES